jgi:hypothetical protein
MVGEFDRMTAYREKKETDDQRDAARYRWLRRFDHFAQVDAMLDTTEYTTLDSAIDAAIAAELEMEKTAREL